jgi:hypothetical protein
VRSHSLENLVARTVYAAGITSSPVDLVAIARLRKVRLVGLRFIIPRGLLIPVDDGFEIYLRSTISSDLSLDRSEPERLLSVRNRFTFAHELAHTFFFDLSESTPKPLSEVVGRTLEETCNRLAGHLLMPSVMLRQQVADYDQIDARLVTQLSRQYRTSLETTLTRLTEIQPASPLERCVLLAKRVGGEAEIRGVYFGLGLQRTLARPRKYTRLRDWLPDFPKIDSAGDSEWRRTLAGRLVRFEKTDVGSSDSFLLQTEVEG